MALAADEIARRASADHRESHGKPGRQSGERQLGAVAIQLVFALRVDGFVNDFTRRRGPIDDLFFFFLLVRRFRHVTSLSRADGPIGCNDLPKRDSTIVRRNALVPVGAEIFGAQTVDRALGQIAILETSAAEHNFRLPDFSRDRDNHFHQHVVKFCRR